jgi:Transposase DDE domain
VTLPKPMTSSAKADGRFGRQDFVYIAQEDIYRCPAGERLTYRYTNEEAGKVLRRYWTTACSKCPIKSQCTTAPERRIARWEHEHLLEVSHTGLVQLIRAGWIERPGRLRGGRVAWRRDEIMAQIPPPQRRP